jgi:hypothetical protein
MLLLVVWKNDIGKSSRTLPCRVGAPFTPLKEKAPKNLLPGIEPKAGLWILELLLLEGDQLLTSNPH